jgi:flagellar FliL protein
MADEEKPEAQAAPATPSKRGKLPLILSAVVLLAGAGAGAWYLGVFRGDAEELHGEAGAAVEEEHGDAHAKTDDGHGGAGGAKAPGPIKPFEPFIANLADDGGKRYLKATFQVEFLGDHVPAELDARLPQVRDLLLTLLTSKTFEEVRTPDGKQQLREEIINRVNQVLERDAVKAVYFTEFIVQ